MKKFAVQKIATKNGNFLVSEGKNFAYFDKKYKFLRLVDEDEWDWALREWGESPRKVSLKYDPFPRFWERKVKPNGGDDSSEVRYYYFPKNHPKQGIVKIENTTWWHDGDWNKSVEAISLQQAINLKGELRDRIARSQFIVDKNKKLEEEWREMLAPINGISFSPSVEGDYDYNFSVYLPIKSVNGEIKLFGNESYKIPEACFMKTGSFKKKEIHILNKDMKVIFSFNCKSREEED